MFLFVKTTTQLNLLEIKGFCPLEREGAFNLKCIQEVLICIKSVLQYL